VLIVWSNLCRRRIGLIAILLILAFGIATVYWLGNNLWLNNSARNRAYVLVGGQRGGWFEAVQTPELYRVALRDLSTESLTPVSSQGTVWTGSWNGSQWLISGWGTDSGPQGSNPYLYLYDGENQVVGSSLNQYENEATWRGGDIFGVSYNGSDWLLSGLGSGSLKSWSPQSNHMGLALFDGRTFTDLSSQIPDQWDAPLFANDWNGHYWLVGGGWEGNEGELYRYDGANLTDLSQQLESVLPFHSVQTIHWNGNYWLIGGMGFLTRYDGQRFADLTPQLDAAIGSQHKLSYSLCCNSVNALAWNGTSWTIGGGSPVAVTQPLTAWSVNFDGTNFTDLTASLPPSVARPSHSSSILSIAWVDGSWFFGGYADDNGTFFSIANSTTTDLSNLVNSDFTVVNWVGGLPQTPMINAKSFHEVGGLLFASDTKARGQNSIRRDYRSDSRFIEEHSANATTVLQI